ncbi:MAG: 50S ribosomal protein L13 [Lentisphaerae bacterium]|nr:50S ribosomal protein L13 [Lentisphaerota bacterium]
MKSFSAKTGEIERKHILFDANGVVLGRLAVKIADALRGKDKPTYTPHIETGSFVIVINAAKVKLTGKKEDRKIYDHYSGYRSGLKKLTAGEVRKRTPEKLIQDAVWGMLPSGRMGRSLYRNMKVYAGAEHPHQAQNPELVTL